MRTAVGLALLLVTIAPLVVAATGVRRRVLPAWSGAPAILATVIVTLVMVVVTAEVLGAVGQFALAPLCVGFIVVGLALWRIVGRPAIADRATGPDGPAPPSTLSRPVQAACAAGIATVVGAWLLRSIASVSIGLEGSETFRYHLPHAARFAETGDLLAIHYVDSVQGGLIAYYPWTSEMLHGIGIVYLGSDLVSHFLPFLYMLLALLGAWCIGRPAGVSWVSTLGAAVVFAAPLLETRQAATGANDTLGAALIVVAVGLVVTAVWDGTAVPLPIAVMAGLAVGLSVGTKLTFLVAAAALTALAVALGGRGRRVHVGAAWCLAAVVAGGFWYLRNFLDTGNPVPAVGFAIGPVEFSEVPLAQPSFSLVESLTHDGVWSDFIRPGLRSSLGPLWPVTLALVLGGCGACLVAPRARPVVRLAALVALVTVGGYLVIGFPYGPDPSQPAVFRLTLRYLAHAAVIALAVLPTLEQLRGRLGTVLVVAYLSTIGLTRFAHDVTPATLWDLGGPVLSILVVGAIVAVVGVVAAGRLPQVRGPWLAGAGFGAIAAVIVAAGVADARVLDGRYAVIRGIDSLRDWAWEAEDIRIALVGDPQQYTFYGHDLSNHVQYVGVEGENHEFLEIDRCDVYAEFLRDGDYTHVLVGPRIFTTGAVPQREWTRRIADVEVEVEQGDRAIYAIVGEIDPSECQGTGTT